MSQAYMSQDQILDLGRRWADAELRADVEALDGLLDADFVCVGPLGGQVVRGDRDCQHATACRVGASASGPPWCVWV